MKKLSLTAAALLPQTALAHPGDHSHASPLHMLTEADHLAVIVVVMAAAIAAWIWHRGRS